MRGKRKLVGERDGLLGLTDELTEFVASCCAERVDEEVTVGAKLMAVNVYHEQWGGLSPPWKQFRINKVDKYSRLRFRLRK